jgi:hypothetical protein
LQKINLITDPRIQHGLRLLTIKSEGPQIKPMGINDFHQLYHGAASGLNTFSDPSVLKCVQFNFDFYSRWQGFKGEEKFSITGERYDLLILIFI